MNALKMKAFGGGAGAARAACARSPAAQAAAAVAPAEPPPSGSRARKSAAKRAAGGDERAGKSPRLAPQEGRPDAPRHEATARLLKANKVIKKKKKGQSLAAKLSRGVLPALSMKITIPEDVELATDRRAAARAEVPKGRDGGASPCSRRAPTQAQGAARLMTRKRKHQQEEEHQSEEGEQGRQPKEPPREKRVRFQRETVSDGEDEARAAKPSKVKGPKGEELRFLSLSSLEVPKEQVPTTTKPEPFRLVTAERGAQHRSLLECKLDEEEKAAKRARIPRAHGLPMSTDLPMVPPKPESRGLTVPEPFRLAAETLHAKCEEERRRALEAEEQLKREAAAFKAKPVWRGVPFRPLDVDVPLTVPEPVVLNTSSRVAERANFNRLMAEKRLMAEARAKEAEEEQRRREEEELRQLRQRAVFRAAPLPDMSAPPPAQLPPPPRPLTIPLAPALGRRQRR